MEGNEYRGGNAGWMCDEEHFEVMERACVQCGDPAAFYPGERCEACWNVAGRPLPRARDEPGGERSDPGE